MPFSHISRRRAGKLLLAAGLSAGIATSAEARNNRRNKKSAAFQIDRASIEWQHSPQALDQTRPRFHWTLAAADSKARSLSQSAFRLSILSGIDRRVIFESGQVASSTQNFRPQEAVPFASQTPYVWQLQVWDQDGQATTFLERAFATGIISPSAKEGSWIAFTPDLPDHHRAIEGHWSFKDQPEPLPLFRKTFTPSTRPVFAHLAVAGLGQYQLWLNGQQISPPGLNGAWTDYDHLVLYDAYDITKFITPGEQVFGVALGNGFFNVEAINGRYTKMDSRFGQPQVWIQLKLHYSDGRQETMVSDGSWQTRIGGTGYSSIYGGEGFDARQDDGKFRANDGWQSAVTVSGPKGELDAATFRPAIEADRHGPKSFTSPKAGLTVYDFGINHAGRPAIRLKTMPAGAVVRMYPAELLGEDGTVDQESMTGGGNPGLHGICFTYTCRGGDSESWQPQFTYTGYRYLQIEGADRDHIQSLESLAIRADLDAAGSFSCSDKNMDAIHGLVRQALLSNTASVLTDCPTREKLGWLEQIYLNAATTVNNLDSVRLYEKMCKGMRDAQEPNGMMPAIAPEFIKFLDKNGDSTMFRDSPEWGAAIVLAPWYVYQRYGDLGIIEDNYDAMVGYMSYLESRLGPDGLLNFGLGDWYDIGPKHPGEAQLTTRKMTGTATFYAELVVLQKVAGLLGKSDRDHFGARADALKVTMRGALFDPVRSTFDTGSQTAQAMALVLGLFPDEHKQKALEILIADIRSHESHVTAGDIGFHYVVRALSDNGRADVLHGMLSRTDGPSYLQQIENGATALTEAWNGWREASQNHFMLGHAEIWFFQGLGGVQIDYASSHDAPIILAPQIVAGIDQTRVECSTVLGRVSCRTSLVGDRRSVDVEIPVGQTARLQLPYRAGAEIFEGSLPVDRAPGLTTNERNAGFTWVTLASGSYHFSGAA